MSIRFKIGAAVLIVLILIVGCGKAEPTATSPPTATFASPTPTPTPTPVSPTNTPLPPTAAPTTTPEATAVPSTATPLPPTDTPVPPTATAATSAPEPGIGVQGFLLEDAGFRTPESMLYDPEADLYLVANIQGDPSAKDGNGFISRISPEGEVIALKWIDGQAEGVTLHAPKGMALTGERLFVADIDVVRVFDRETGGRLDDVSIEGARFLNDVAADEEGTVYVTDSGTGVVHRISFDGSLAQAGQVQNPNGIQVRGETILVTGGSNQVFLLGDEGALTAMYETPAGGLDGLILLDDGSVLVSSWTGSAVYQIDADGQVSELFSGIKSPADIGFDTQRQLVLIPHFEDDRVEARPMASPSQPDPVSGLARYEPSDCQFKEPPGYEFECGNLIVPEDRSQPGGPMVRLHVAIVRSRNANPAPDPVIYLTGGGGVDTFDYLPWFLSTFGDAILQDRDLIFFNQRGMHHNDPQLQCPGLPDLLQRLAAPDPNGEYIDRQEREARQAAFFADCYAALVAQGINLEMYDSATSAADADDLRAALGYDQVNYYGSSYGTLLGLLIMRDHPQGARSVVLDSVVPPDADYYIEFGINAYDTFRKLFDGCASDPRCSQQHPDLEEKLLQVVDQLNANPRTTTWNGSQEVMYDGGTFIDAIYLFPYIGEPEMAIEAIEGASRGDFSIADDWAPATMDLDSYQIQWGFYRNRECREEVPFYSYEDYYALMEGLPPQIVAHYKPSLILALCEGWAVEPAAPIENEAVVSDVPALVLSGEIDPITPPRWARGAAEHLSKSYYYVFAGYGHGVTRKSDCALAMMLQFFDDPTQEPDTSCLD